MIAPKSVIEIRGLSVWFHERLVLEGIDLNVRPGEIVVVIGPSGSGKTTLLRGVNRLNECFEGCRTQGTVLLRFDGSEVDAYRGRFSLSELRRRAAMVFQNPNVLPTSIERNFAIPLKAVLGCSPDEVRSRMISALREVDLLDEVEGRLGSGAATLSGGQQQRLCLARALALEPAILLVDEPTANLDFKSARQIEGLLVRMKGRRSIVAVSHSLGQTRRIADRVIVLREGRIVRSLQGDDIRDPVVFQGLLEEVF